MKYNTVYYNTTILYYILIRIIEELDKSSLKLEHVKFYNNYVET